MEIRIRATGAVMFESEFRTIAGASWDQTTVEILDQLGADPVLEGPQITPTRYQTVYRDGVEQIDGQWFTKYSLAKMDVEAMDAHDAQQAKGVRDDRNKRLADCDWTQLADAPVDDLVWAAYRQSLRDVPLQAGFPWDINWPEAP
tara:strand:+ start:66 stop:500 length:435 start_codon:yes stop_codon:yes gene_type:complete